MKEGLIPVLESDLDKAYQNRCIDENGYSACSIYHFSIKNIGNVSQELTIKMIPTINIFHNLYYKVYEVNENDNSVIREIKELNHLEYNKREENTLIKKLTLKENEKKVYEIVFLVLDNGKDQSESDADKNFGAGIKVESIATGEYISTNIGATCWDTEAIVDEPGNFKLVKFNGLDDEGNVIEGCRYDKNTGNGYIENNNDGSYSVYIPSEVGTQRVTTLGMGLFSGSDGLRNGEFVINHYNNIKSVTIYEGITTIEDSVFDGSAGLEDATFGALNIDMKTFEPLYSNSSLTLPSTLTHIGDSAFVFSQFSDINYPNKLEYIGNMAFILNSMISSITIPKSVSVIGEYAFAGNSNLESIEFLTETDGTSNLRTIGNGAFNGCNLSYNNKKSPLVIPQSVTFIDESAFDDNSNLLFIKYTGNHLGTFSLNWYNSSNTCLCTDDECRSC